MTDDLSHSQLEPFTLKDADGVDHQYEIKAHGAIEGQRVLWSLFGLGAEPLGQVVQGVVQTGDLIGQIQAAMIAARDAARKDGAKPAQAQGAALGAVLELDLQALLAGVQWSKFGAAIGQVLASGEAPDLTRELLRHTFRDGQPLSNDLTFDRAYARNYGELIGAVYQSIRINRFFTLPGIS